MLEPIRHIISQQRVILASGSPRRLEILKMIGLKFEVESSKFEENLDKHSFSHPCEYVKENAKGKAIDVWNRLTKGHSPSDHPDLVIGADTVVTLYDEIMEKPKDKEDAFEMLKRLSGLKHTVFTGVALVTKPKKLPTSLPKDGLSSGKAEGDISTSEDRPQDYLVTTFHESTDVTMAELNDEIIRSYIATGEPLDKAGSYGIQALGATLVEQIKGDYYNVVGMPLHRLCRELYILHCEI